jgi:hypothetical protein
MRCVTFSEVPPPSNVRSAAVQEELEAVAEEEGLSVEIQASSGTRHEWARQKLQQGAGGSSPSRLQLPDTTDVSSPSNSSSCPPHPPCVPCSDVLRPLF